MPEVFEHQVYRWVNAITDAAPSIHILTGSGTRSIAEMSHSEVSRNQCWKVATAITALADIPNAEVSLVGVSSLRGSHYATLIRKEASEVIVDFTASQFSRHAPFPVVMDKETWRVWVQKFLGDIQWID